MSTAAVPELVTLHVWGVPTHRIPSAVLRMGLDRRAVRRTPGVRFAKLLGTADGRTFAPRDTDPHHWGLLTSWDDLAAADAFATSRTARAWAAFADETLVVRLHPLSSRGTWSGRTPFGQPGPTPSSGRVAALTRARIRTSMWRRFWSAVPPVAGDLHSRDGVLVTMGIGEAPIGLQGTFSIWSDALALRDFAHRGAEHQRAIAATRELDWYSEELFARFSVESTTGTYLGQEVAP